MVRNEKLNYIKTKYKRYINDSNCVYDLILNEWLIILRNVFRTYKNENDQMVQYRVTKNNESRVDIFDPLYATFRADILHVCKIINVETLEETDECFYNDPNTKESTLIVFWVGENINASNLI